MSRNVLKRLPKGLKKWFLIGLPIILLYLIFQKKMGIAKQVFISFGKYSKLLPYIVAQSKLETSNFNSQVYKLDNNMFGMKENSRGFSEAGKGVSSPEGNRYAHYRYDFNSLLDYIAWLNQTDFPASVSSANEFASELKQRNYFTSSLSGYQSALKSWLS